jgi:hypothetical protein
MCQQGTPNLRYTTRRGWRKAEVNIVSNSMSAINFRPCNKRTTVSAYLLPYHPSVHLQETYNLSSYQRMIRQRPSSWNLKLKLDRKCEKVADPVGTTVNRYDWLSSILRKYSRTNTYKEYKSNTLHHARSACWTCIPLFKNSSWGRHPGAETCRRFTVIMAFILWILFYCILQSAFVGWYIDCKNMPCMSNWNNWRSPYCPLPQAQKSQDASDNGQWQPLALSKGSSPFQDGRRSTIRNAEEF